jgi:nicotinamide-nucleotide amidase
VAVIRCGRRRGSPRLGVPPAAPRSFVASAATWPGQIDDRGRLACCPLAYCYAMTRQIQAAELLAVGTELTTGSTRDTNTGDLARELTELGVSVRRISDLPDDLEAVRRALIDALAIVDLVIITGGLGPTPDDLTREAIAASTGLETYVDEELERWLRGLFARRRLAMPAANRKQAWLVPGATALPNERGTAPGWWLELPEGRLLIALPGPPAEMWPMWREHARPRLVERGVGRQRVSRTLRLTGVGESVLVGLIGEKLLRSSNPQVATYAKADSVDVRVTAVGSLGSDDASSEGASGSADEGSAAQLVRRTVEDLLGRIGEYVFAEGDEGWPEALGRLLGERRLATVEIGTAGQLAALLGNAPFFQYGQLLRAAAADEHARDHLGLYAERVRETSGADVGLAVHAREVGADMHVDVAIASAAGTLFESRPAFLTGEQGRRRAALAACGVLWQRLRAGELEDRRPSEPMH